MIYFGTKINSFSSTFLSQFYFDNLAFSIIIGRYLGCIFKYQGQIKFSLWEYQFKSNFENTHENSGSYHRIVVSVKRPECPKDKLMRARKGTKGLPVGPGEPPRLLCNIFPSAQTLMFLPQSYLGEYSKYLHFRYFGEYLEYYILLCNIFPSAQTLMFLPQSLWSGQKTKLSLDCQNLPLTWFAS